jgi:hypothetical protein
MEEFRERYLRDPVFLSRYFVWAKHEFLPSLRPSFDRIDCFGGYTFDNLQILTSRGNFCKAVEDKKLHKERKEKRKMKYYEERHCGDCEEDRIQKIEIFEKFTVYECTICQNAELNEKTP